jgi:hypothetical protein
MVDASTLIPAAATLAACAALGLVGSGAAAPRTACGPPRLTIVSPTAGETVSAPLRAQFSVRCFRLGLAPYGHIHAWTGPPGSTRRIELRPHRQSGVLEVGGPLLSGPHTLTFQLARANHTAVTNRTARVVVRDVVFEGP